AARSGSTDESHEREARHPALVGDALPVARLVDERLADVEHDRGHSHEAIFARSSAVVTLSRRVSPSTTLTRPPAASTSPAQSVASPVAARRKTSARNACGVWTA